MTKTIPGEALGLKPVIDLKIVQRDLGLSRNNMDPFQKQQTVLMPAKSSEPPSQVLQTVYAVTHSHLYQFAGTGPLKINLQNYCKLSASGTEQGKHAFKQVRDHSIALPLKEQTRQLLMQQPEGEISRGLHCRGQSTACTNLQISYIDMHDRKRNLQQKVAYAIGWRTHFNFCVANLLSTGLDDRDPVLRKSRQFTIFEFMKKQELEDVVSDTDDSP